MRPAFAAAHGGGPVCAGAAFVANRLAICGETFFRGRACAIMHQM